MFSILCVFCILVAFIANSSVSHASPEQRWVCVFGSVWKGAVYIALWQFCVSLLCAFLFYVDFLTSWMF